MGKLSHIRRTKMLAQKERCYYCDLPMWDPELDHAVPEICRAPVIQRYLRCTAEHLHPRSEGGADTPGNIVAACWYCNTRRHHRKVPPSPDIHRARVQERMEKGKWLAAQVKQISTSVDSCAKVQQGVSLWP